MTVSEKITRALKGEGSNQKDKHMDIATILAYAAVAGLLRLAHEDNRPIRRLGDDLDNE